MKIFAPFLILLGIAAAIPNNAASWTEEQWLDHLDQAAAKGVKPINTTELTRRSTFPVAKRMEGCGADGLFVCSGGCGCTGIPCTRYVSLSRMLLPCVICNCLLPSKSIPPFLTRIHI